MSNVISLQNLAAKSGLEDGTIRSVTETDTDCTVQLVHGDVTGNISIAKEGDWVDELIKRCAGWVDLPEKPKKAAKRGR
jgi:hypothetical protein